MSWGESRDEWIARKESELLAIAATQTKPPGCRGCPLEKRPFVPHQGKIRTAEIVIVLEAPGGDEPAQGIPAVGRAGQRMDAMLDQVGVDRWEQIGSGRLGLTNSFKCCPPYGTPLDQSTMGAVIKQCRSVFLEKELAGRKKPPKVIIAMGNAAMQAMTNQRGITRLRGQVLKSPWLPDVPIVPTFHPAAVLRDPSLSKFVVKDLAYALNDVSVNGFTQRGITTQSLLCLTDDDLDACLFDLKENPQKIFGIDFETSGLGWDANAACLAVSAETEKSWVIPFRWWADDATVQHQGVIWNQIVAFTRSRHARIVEVVREIIGAARLVMIHNAKHDLKYLFKNFGISWWGTEPKLCDTLVWQALLDENISKKLDDLTPMWTDMGRYKSVVADYVKVHPEARTNYCNIPPEVLVAYVAADADAGRRIGLAQLKELKASHLVKYWVNFRRPLIPTLLEMEYHGLLVDRIRHGRFVKAADIRLRDLQAQFRSITGDPDFNPNSPLQLRKHLIDGKGLVSPRITGKGQPSLGKLAIQEMLAVARQDGGQADPVLELLPEHRDLSKMQSTSGRGLLKYLAKDDRLRPDISVGFTVTGRLSSRNPNCQNFPRGDKGVVWTDPKANASELLTVRSLIVAPLGFMIVAGDFSQVELRCAAIFSGDKLMMKLFHEDRDVHLASAAMILGKREILEGTDAHIDWCRKQRPSLFGSRDWLPIRAPETMEWWREFLERQKSQWTPYIVLKAERSLFKSMVFGKLYGATNDKLADITGYDPEYIDQIFGSYWMRFKELKVFLDVTVPNQIEQDQQVVSPWGLIRHFPGGFESSALRGRQERQGVNFLPQSAAAEITNAAMCGIQHEMVRRRMQSRLILNVHDSLIAEAFEGELVQVKRLMIRWMLRPVPQMQHYIFPISLGHGHSLAEAEAEDRVTKHGRFVVEVA